MDELEFGYSEDEKKPTQEADPEKDGYLYPGFNPQPSKSLRRYLTG